MDCGQYWEGNGIELGARCEVAQEHISSHKGQLDGNSISIERRIAVGGSAEVFVGHLNCSLVAVQRLLKSDEDTVRCIRWEAGQLMAMSHPNIVRFIGYIVPEPAIVTEFMSGGSLFQFLKSCKDEALSLENQVAVSVSVARAMALLHSCKPPMLHKDLKSPNILIDHAGVVKIANVGLSLVRHGVHAKRGFAGCIPDWTAPEVLQSMQPTMSSDVYSYGVILWELLTGRVPWEGLSPIQVVGAVGFASQALPVPALGDPYLISMCQACLSSDAALRPTFKEIVVNLEQHFGVKNRMLPVVGLPVDKCLESPAVSGASAPAACQMTGDTHAQQASDVLTTGDNHAAPQASDVLTLSPFMTKALMMDSESDQPSCLVDGPLNSLLMDIDGFACQGSDSDGQVRREQQQSSADLIWRCPNSRTVSSLKMSTESLCKAFSEVVESPCRKHSSHRVTSAVARALEEEQCPLSPDAEADGCAKTDTVTSSSVHTPSCGPLPCAEAVATTPGPCPLAGPLAPASLSLQAGTCGSAWRERERSPVCGSTLLGAARRHGCSKCPQALSPSPSAMDRTAWLASGGAMGQHSAGRQQCHRRVNSAGSCASAMMVDELNEPLDWLQGMCSTMQYKRSCSSDLVSCLFGEAQVAPWQPKKQTRLSMSPGLGQATPPGTDRSSEEVPRPSCPLPCVSLEPGVTLPLALATTPLIGICPNSTGQLDLLKALPAVKVTPAAKACARLSRPMPPSPDVQGIDVDPSLLSKAEMRKTYRAGRFRVSDFDLAAVVSEPALLTGIAEENSAAEVQPASTIATTGPPSKANNRPTTTTTVPNMSAGSSEKLPEIAPWSVVGFPVTTSPVRCTAEDSMQSTGVPSDTRISGSGSRSGSGAMDVGELSGFQESAQQLPRPSTKSVYEEGDLMQVPKRTTMYRVGRFFVQSEETVPMLVEDANMGAAADKFITLQTTKSCGCPGQVDNCGSDAEDGMTALIGENECTLRSSPQRTQSAALASSSMGLMLEATSDKRLPVLHHSSPVGDPNPSGSEPGKVVTHQKVKRGRFTVTIESNVEEWDCGSDPLEPSPTGWIPPTSLPSPSQANTALPPRHSSPLPPLIAPPPEPGTQGTHPGTAPASPAPAPASPQPLTDPPHVRKVGRFTLLQWVPAAAAPCPDRPHSTERRRSADQAATAAQPASTQMHRSSSACSLAAAEPGAIPGAVPGAAEPPATSQRSQMRLVGKAGSTDVDAGASVARASPKEGPQVQMPATPYAAQQSSKPGLRAGRVGRFLVYDVEQGVSQCPPP